MRQSTIGVLIVVSTVLVTAWICTFAFIWLGISPLSGATIRINPLLPHRATLSVRYVENGNTITGLLKFKGVHCDSGEWWNNGVWIASESSGLSSFTGSWPSAVPSVSVSCSSSSFYSINEWACGGKPILREQRTGFEPFVHGVLPQIAGYVALMVVWRRRMQEPSDEAVARRRSVKFWLIWAYGLSFLALISFSAYAYCSASGRRLPVFDNVLVVIWLGAILFSLTSVLHVIRGGSLQLSLFTLPLCLAFSGVVTFWLMAVGIL